jgi:hypothetical protein
MLELWYRRESSTAIKAMGYKEMKFWHGKHEILKAAEKAQADQAGA